MKQIWSSKNLIYFIDCSEGHIGLVGDMSDNVSASSMVLGLGNCVTNGYEVNLQPKNESCAETQMWVRGKDLGQGWFTLKNQTSGKLLTAKNESSQTAEGKYLSFEYRHFSFNTYSTEFYLTRFF